MPTKTIATPEPSEHTMSAAIAVLGPNLEVEDLPVWCQDCELARDLAVELELEPDVVYLAEVPREVGDDYVLLCHMHNDMHAEAEIEALAIAVGVLEPQVYNVFGQLVGVAS